MKLTEDVDALINDYFITPKKVTVALSGTPLDNISQTCYAVPNFYTKVNVLVDLLKESDLYSKVLVFVSNKKSADRLFEAIDEFYGSKACLIHSNKTQNYRLRSIRQFDEGQNRILVTTDVMARGLDLDKISHVINFDTPSYPENYMHRIGRTGRAEEKGASLLFYTEKEKASKEEIEALMGNPEKRDTEERGAGFHEKKEKNKRTNQGGSYKRIIAKKYKKRKTKGDKNYNKRNKRK